MIYYFVVGISSLLFASGILVFRKVFYNLATSTLSLLDSMLDSTVDEMAKQKELVKGLGNLLKNLFLFIASLAIVFMVFLSPLHAYSFVIDASPEDLDTASWLFYLVFGVVSIVPFFIFSRVSKTKDYSEVSQLFHRLVLGNYHISKAIFRLEKNLYLRNHDLNPHFLIVSGLARAGTTAFTTSLHEIARFSSLSYANMPFLLAPNSWTKFYKPSNEKSKERSHGDRVKIGLNSVEALEEYFFKVFLNDSFVGESLRVHEIDEQIYRQYLQYQIVIKGADLDAIYLAKNNNFLLRYKSLRRLNTDFQVVFLVRKPIDHASSLLNQHLKFSELQSADPFVLEYMTWLGHYEFGLGHKLMDFEDHSSSTEGLDPVEIDYWLVIWIRYYEVLWRYIQEAPDSNLKVVDYSAYLTQPTEVLKNVIDWVGVKAEITSIEMFVNTRGVNVSCNQELESTANELYRNLVKYSVN